jgi:Domain of unknown function (DUF4167)
MRQPINGRPGSERRGSAGGGDDAGSARRNYQRYVALAREAGLKGDAIEAENCYQHAEHFYRLLRERQR